MKTKKHKVEIPEGYELSSHQTSERIHIDNEVWIETVVKFKPIKKELPKAWKEYENENDWKHTSEEIKQEKAFFRLRKLRDVYNDGWVPDWKDDNWKHCIIVAKNIVTASSTKDVQGVLSFKNTIIRAEFLVNFRDNLIEQSKPLL